MPSVWLVHVRGAKPSSESVQRPHVKGQWSSAVAANCSCVHPFPIIGSAGSAEQPETIAAYGRVFGLNGRVETGDRLYMTATELFSYVQRGVVEEAERRSRVQVPKFQPLWQMHQKQSCDGQVLFQPGLRGFVKNWVLFRFAQADSDGDSEEDPDLAFPTAEEEFRAYKKANEEGAGVEATATTASADTSEKDTIRMSTECLALSSCEIRICRNERTQLAGSCSRYMWSPDPLSRSKIRAKSEMHRTFSQTCFHIF